MEKNKPDYDPNAGFSLTDIIGYGNATVSFKVKVNSIPTGDYTFIQYCYNKL
ncbi:hypothetical protein Q5M85_05670 [Paraclostridium bifermentans]|nr:hypothetical protein [Paraclostridium bifermentans]